MTLLNPDHSDYTVYCSNMDLESWRDRQENLRTV